MANVQVHPVSLLNVEKLANTLTYISIKGIVQYFEHSSESLCS